VSAAALAQRVPSQARNLGLAGIVAAVLVVLVTVPPVTIENPVVPALLALAGMTLGGLALRGGARFLGWYAVGGSICALILALVIQHASKATIVSIVTASLFVGMLEYGTPLAFAALGGLYSERSGVVNIGLEGMMLTGAFAGIWVADKTGHWYTGVLGAAFFGALLAAVHAVFSIHLQANQIVSGTAINILALGGTGYALHSLYGSNGTPTNIDRIPSISIPGLRSIPYIGDVFGDLNVMIWLMLALVVFSWVLLWRTPVGLRLRAVGEHPRAADTVGVNVYGVRYAAVITSGALAAMGGAYLSFGLLGQFSYNMTAGRGFIALAALIFGKWHPFGLLGASCLFGFATQLGFGLQASAGISGAIVPILPYVLTLVALVGLVGRSTPPAADGIPYSKR
jgi:general nucleoside transport system permease protein